MIFLGASGMTGGGYSGNNYKSGVAGGGSSSRRY